MDVYYCCCRYVGIVDNCCYDLRMGNRIESMMDHVAALCANKTHTLYHVDAIMMSRGIDQCMKRVNRVDKIWSRVKDGASVPFVLQIRLTDEAHFMGHLSIVDLQQPEFRQPLVLQPAASIYCSFEQLSKHYDVLLKHGWLTKQKYRSHYRASDNQEACRDDV